MNWMHNNLIKVIHFTKQFIKNNQNIIFIKTDKGNLTIANSYKDKINSMLSDENTYNMILKDPVNKVINNLKKLVTEWKKSIYFRKCIYFFLYTSDYIVAMAIFLALMTYLRYINLTVHTESLFHALTALYNLALFL